MICSLKEMTFTEMISSVVLIENDYDQYAVDVIMQKYN
jgi:hypothetical protein